VTLSLSAAPDGYGFFYGTAQLGDAFCSVNVLPPQGQWAGDIKLEGYMPDETNWIIFADGEEIARVRNRDDLAAAMLPHLDQG